MGSPHRHAERKGRKKSAPFAMVMLSWMDLPAWQHLSGNGVKLLLYAIKKSKGDNGHSSEKGELFLGEREAAQAIGCARNTASKAIDELAELGWMKPVVVGTFDGGKSMEKGRRATVWRLTFQPHPQSRRGPTSEFRYWKPKENFGAQNLKRTGSKIEHKSPPWEEMGAEIDPADASPSGEEADQFCSISDPHIDIPQGGEQPGGSGSVACVAEAIRSQLIVCWSALDAKGKRALANSTGLTVDEVKRYLDGTDTLSIGKQMALRRATKEAA